MVQFCPWIVVKRGNAKLEKILEVSKCCGQRVQRIGNAWRQCICDREELDQLRFIDFFASLGGCQKLDRFRGIRAIDQPDGLPEERLREKDSFGLQIDGV